jgi:hypothetical protein
MCSQCIRASKDFNMPAPSLDLFVFADALGWVQAERRAFARDLLPVRQPCDTLLGYSSTCDPSILTGRLPQEHGHFSFFVYDPPRSPFHGTQLLGWLPETLAAHHRVRNVVSRWFARRLGYTGYFQLYSVPFNRLPFLDYTEKRDLYLPGGIINGQENIFSHWESSGVPWMRSDWRRSDADNVAHLKVELVRGRVRLAYLFTAGLDAVMHAHTTRSAATDAAFAQFERWLREIATLAGAHYRDFRLHVFSDHGMTDTRAVSSMMPDFESLGLRFGRDYAAVWDSTMVRFWFPGDPAVRNRISAWLAERPEGRIIADAELATNGCLFPDRRYGELWFLLHNGVIFAPSFMNRHRVPAMHGFDPREADSRACWLCNHDRYPAPRRIDGIFDVMRIAAARAAEDR